MNAHPVAGAAAPVDGASLAKASVLPAGASVPSAQAGARVARVAVLGVTGYSGQEFVRLAVRHPGLRLVRLCTREHAGRPLHEALPGIDLRPSLETAGHPLPRQFAEPAAAFDAIDAGEVDTLVCCLPHGAWKSLAAEHRARLADHAESLRIVDLSSDHRDAADGYVYGLPEVMRERIAGALRIANPGCYATAASLALLPALQRGWIEAPVFVSALSGVSGAGRAATLRNTFVERDGGAELYKAGVEHAHVAEMRRTWSTVAGAPIELGFAPQVVPMTRGILAVANAPLARPVSPADVHAAYAEHYAPEPFVRVLEPGAWPDTRAVRGSNRCDVAPTSLHDGTTLMVAAAIDNLVKGAAGQAIQNLNLLLGWPETTSLPLDGVPW